MKDSKLYKNINNKRREGRNSKWFTKFLLSIIIILVSLIVTNFSESIRNTFKEKVLEENINFNKINKMYKKYIGNINNNDETIKVVSNYNDLNNVEKEKKEDGSYEIFVGKSYPVTFLESGIVVFIGDKNNYNDMVIVQGNDGVDIWYSQVVMNNYSLYDYVSKGEILGETNKDTLILNIVKDGKSLEYEKYFA